MRQKGGRASWINAGFILPGLLLLIVFHTYPLISGFVYSLTDWNGVARSFDFIGLDNYVSLLTDARILNTLLFTFKYALVCAVIANVVALAAALALNRKMRFRNMLRSIYFLPSVLGLLIIGYIWREIFGKVIPLLGNSLHISFLQSNLLSDSDLVFWAVALVTVWQSAPLLLVIYLAGLQTIPTDLYEAASIDGANRFNEFAKITLPLIMPSITICFVLAMKNNLMVYDLLVALTGGGPGFSTESVTMLIYNVGILNNRYAYGLASSILLFIIILLTALLQVVLLRRKEVQL
ncbi:sugar ABC transporter permease [Paenibacillus tritici]|jgi:raffinose/stachyose/melibiose transport system permease protein|uniref:Sugar ABC transporter permease n=1 Tax=Paenibacillus tritici TaxID=1873425 RepID=A0ABX2DJJ7_9BACL|nr:sugar ABC transporter permease [Paenibacillus tritici]NQX44650.1 sugar ABC transporter permease [Paenibacillus tritici]